MTIVSIAVFAVTLAIAFGLSYWAFRARHDRSARVGLYLLFGIPGALLVVAGAVQVIYGRGGGWTFFFIGLALAVPLVKPVRSALASFTPMDPESPVDMAGLCILLPIICYFFLSYLAAPEPEAVTTPVSIADLVVQALALASLSYAAVGLRFHRSFREATARLGLHLPTPRIVLIAVGFMVLGFIASGVASVLTQIFQPDLSEQIQRATEDLTANVQNPVGAVMLGLSAGIGEELLLRGAIQPRFGILLTSLLFALLHVQYGLTYVLIGLFVMGVILGLERRYFGTTAAIITHALFNTIVVLVQSSA